MAGNLLTIVLDVNMDCEQSLSWIAEFETLMLRFHRDMVPLDGVIGQAAPRDEKA